MSVLSTHMVNNEESELCNEHNKQRVKLLSASAVKGRDEELLLHKLAKRGICNQADDMNFENIAHIA